MPDLEEAIDLYDRGGVPNPHLDKDVRPLHLSRREKFELVAFLQALTGESVSVTVPELPK